MRCSFHTFLENMSAQTCPTTPLSNIWNAQWWAKTCLAFAHNDERVRITAAAVTASAASVAALNTKSVTVTTTPLPAEAHAAVSLLIESVGKHCKTMAPAHASSVSLIMQGAIGAAFALGDHPRLSWQAWKTLLCMVPVWSRDACAARAACRKNADALSTCTRLRRRVHVFCLLANVLWRAPIALLRHAVSVTAHSAKNPHCLAPLAHVWLHAAFANTPSFPALHTASVLCAGIFARLDMQHLRNSKQYPSHSMLLSLWWLPAGKPGTCMECIVCREEYATLSAPAWQTLPCGCVMHIACLLKFAALKPNYWAAPKCLQCQQHWLPLVAYGMHRG